MISFGKLKSSRFSSMSKRRAVCGVIKPMVFWWTVLYLHHHNSWSAIRSFCREPSSSKELWALIQLAVHRWSGGFVVASYLKFDISYASSLLIESYKVSGLYFLPSGIMYWQTGLARKLLCARISARPHQTH